MGHKFIYLAIIGAILYGTPVYAAEIVCHNYTNEIGCIEAADYGGFHSAEEIPCVWLPFNSGGICTKPCHLRSVAECNAYNSTDTSHNSFCMVEDSKCIPICSNMSDNKEACNRNIGCVYNGDRQTCSGCSNAGTYYESAFEWIDVQNDPPYFSRKTVGGGSCKQCNDSNNKPANAKWLSSSSGTIGACAWEIQCSAGFGMVTERGCGSCDEGKSSLPEEWIKFIPDGTTDQTVDACSEPCPAGYYCDGEHGQQPCPSVKDGVTGMTSEKGAIREDQCYITKDTVFCDSHGCFTLPLGDAKLRAI